MIVILTHNSMEQGNRRHQTSPTVCNPSPHFVDDNRLIQCLQSSACLCSVTLHGPVQFAIIRGVRLVGQYFSPKLPLFLWDRHPDVTHCSSGQAHSLFQTASPSIQPFFCMGLKCYAVQCVVSGEENPQNCPVPLVFYHPVEDNRPSHGHRQHAQNIW